MSQSRNGAPYLVNNGKEDALNRDGRKKVFEEKIPKHLPYVPLFCQKGTTDPMIVNYQSGEHIYGAETFNMNSAFATHQTALPALVFNDVGDPRTEELPEHNQYYMVHRLRPDDAQSAYIALSLDVGNERVPEYRRMPDGSFELDSEGKRIETGRTVDVTKLRWVHETLSEEDFATRGRREGTFVTTDNDATLVVDDEGKLVITDRTQRVPIVDFKVAGFGSHGNNLGISMWVNDSLRQSGTVLGEDPFNAPAYFMLKVMERPSPSQSATAKQTLRGVDAVPFTLHPTAEHATTKRSLYLPAVIEEEYASRNTRPVDLGVFEDVYMYEDNISAVLNSLYEKEAAYHPDWPGVSEGYKQPGDEFRLDVMSGKDKNGDSYETFFVDNTGTDGLIMNEYNIVYASGGYDGDMSPENYDRLCREQFANWGDLEHRFRGMSYFPQNHIYDTGFSMETKEAMIEPTARRRDMIAILSPEVFGESKLTQTETSSVCSTLATLARNRPESMVEGTEQCRVELYPGRGRLHGSNYRKDVCGTVAYAKARAIYMGSEEAKWRPNMGWDGKPYNLIDMFDSRTYLEAQHKDYDVTQDDWGIGMCNIIHHDRSIMQMAATRTVYRNEDSPLSNSINVAMAAQVEMDIHKVWMDLLNGGKMSSTEFLARSDSLIKSRTENIYDGRGVVEVKTYFNSTDATKGYSWTTEVTIKAKNGWRLNKAKIVSDQSDDFYPVNFTAV